MVFRGVSAPLAKEVPTKPRERSGLAEFQIGLHANDCAAVSKDKLSAAVIRQSTDQVLLRAEVSVLPGRDFSTPASCPIR
jgi:hypothetical protein